MDTVDTVEDYSFEEAHTLDDEQRASLAGHSMDDINAAIADANLSNEWN